MAELRQDLHRLGRVAVEAWIPTLRVEDDEIEVIAAGPA